MSSRRKQSPSKKCSCDDKDRRSSCRSSRYKRSNCTCEKHAHEHYTACKHHCCSCKEHNHCYHSLCKYSDKPDDMNDDYDNNSPDEHNKNIQNIVITIKHC